MTFDIFENLPDTLVALGTLIGAFGALILTLRNGRTQSKAKQAAEDAAKAAAAAAAAAAKAEAQIALVDGRIVELGVAVDGRLAKLMEEVEKRSFAEGKAQGRTDERADAKARQDGVRTTGTTPDVMDVKIVGTKGSVPVTVKNQQKKSEESDSGFEK